MNNATYKSPFNQELSEEIEDKIEVSIRCVGSQALYRRTGDPCDYPGYMVDVYPERVMVDVEWLLESEVPQCIYVNYSDDEYPIDIELEAYFIDMSGDSAIYEFVTPIEL